MVRLSEGVDGAGGELGEGVVIRGEDGEGAWAGEGVDQAGGLDGGDEGGEVWRGGGVLDDGLVGVHGGAADIGIGLLGGGTEGGDGESRGSECSEKSLANDHCSPWWCLSYGCVSMPF